VVFCLCDLCVSLWMVRRSGVEAVEKVALSPSHNTAPALEAYAQRLQTQRDGMDKNPMGQRYLEGKIKEVREAITFITRKA